MSLINTASSWNNDIPPTKNKMANIRKMLATNKNNGNTEGFTGTITGHPFSSNTTSTNKNKMETQTDTNRNRIHHLIEKMTSSKEEGGEIEENEMANYRPFYPKNEFVPQTVPMVAQQTDNGKNARPYTPASPNLGGNQTNYSIAYNQRIHTPTSLNYAQNGANDKPYYSKYGIGGGGDGMTNEKLMERINYMIHLLEEQQLEKTNYVMEEFIMYSFLGVFMIYVCDTFSTAGKYVR